MKKILSQQIVHSNNWYKIRKDIILDKESKKESNYFILERMHSVFIIPILNNKIILIKHYRYPTNKVGWEIPAGSIDKGEEVIDAAKRELLEETGYISKDLVQISEFETFNGISNEIGYIFVAKSLEKINDNLMTDEEIIDIKAFLIQEIHELIIENQIHDAQTLSALYIFEQQNKKNKFLA